MVCLGGCPRDSKQSSLVTTIRRALENGLTVETEFLVNNILDGRDKVTVFGSQRGERTEINAPKSRSVRGRIRFHQRPIEKRVSEARSHAGPGIQLSSSVHDLCHF
jgi:hypothetical protein